MQPSAFGEEGIPWEGFQVPILFRGKEPIGLFCVGAAAPFLSWWDIGSINSPPGEEIRCRERASEGNWLASDEAKMSLSLFGIEIKLRKWQQLNIIVIYYCRHSFKFPNPIRIPDSILQFQFHFFFEAQFRARGSQLQLRAECRKKRRRW